MRHISSHHSRLFTTPRKKAAYIVATQDDSSLPQRYYTIRTGGFISRGHFENTRAIFDGNFRVTGNYRAELQTRRRNRSTDVLRKDILLFYFLFFIFFNYRSGDYFICRAEVAWVQYETGGERISKVLCCWDEPVIISILEGTSCDCNRIVKC